MNFGFQRTDLFDDFRVAATLGVAAAGLLFLTPFAVNNLLQGRYLLGAGSMGIVVILGLDAWDIRRGRFRPWLNHAVLAPAIVFFLVIAFRGQGIVGALWCYPAILSFYFMLPERKAWAANAALLLIAAPQAWVVLEHPIAARVAATLTVVSAFSAIFIRVISVQQRRLQNQAVTDHLTGLPNRVLLDTALEQAVEQARRIGTPMTLLALDLDHFKRINDTLGHAAGDAVLHSLGALLRKRTRRANKAFRLGGEEFVVLLHGTDAEHGRQVAEELRLAVESFPFLPDRTVTISVGLASLASDEPWREWLRRSDEQLYRAKAAGRNRVMG